MVTKHSREVRLTLLVAVTARVISSSWTPNYVVEHDWKGVFTRERVQFDPLMTSRWFMSLIDVVLELEG
jgi:hypothetical protein